MNWGDTFLALMSVGYLLAAGAYLAQGNHGYAIALFCYSVANAGLIWAAK